MPGLRVISARCSLWYVAAVAAAVSSGDQAALPSRGLGIGFAWFGSKQKKTMIGKASLCPKHWLPTSGLELEERNSSPPGSRHPGGEGKPRVVWDGGGFSGAQRGLLRRDSGVTPGGAAVLFCHLLGGLWMSWGGADLFLCAQDERD